MTTFSFGPLKIDAVELGSRGNAVLGIRDSGKTVTAKVLGEHLHDANIPLVVFDPSGTWRHLRVPGHGKGRPVVVAGGRDGDLPLTPASAPRIVEAAMQAGLSLVLHLDLSLSKSDWRAIVRDSVRLLMQKNGEHGLRHVILEEAAEFVPQVVRGDIAVVYAEVERMVRIGGNAGLGCTLVNQRAEEINKAVLELCDNLFLHRQKGRNSLTALTKWLDVGAVKDGKAVIDSLSTLPSGQCWAWLHGSDQPVHVKVPMCDSFHPNRRELRSGAALAKLKAVPMEDFVEKLRAQLPQIEEERKANDPKLLKAEIARLKAELARNPASAAPTVQNAKPEQIEAARKRGWDAHIRERAKQYKAAQVTAGIIERRLTGVIEEATEMRAQVSALLETLRTAPEMPTDVAPAPAPVRQPQPTAWSSKGNAPTASPKPSSEPPVTAEGLSRPQQKILDALAWFASIGVRDANRSPVAMLADQSPKSSGFRNNLSVLANRAMITYLAGGGLALTDAGAAAANPPQTSPTTAELQQAIKSRLGAPQARMLEVLFTAGGQPVDRETLARESDQSPSSSGFRNNMSVLSSFGFLRYLPEGQVAATPICFVE